MKFFSKSRINKSFTEKYAPWVAIFITIVFGAFSLVNYIFDKNGDQVKRAEDIFEEYSGTESTKESLKGIHTELTLLATSKALRNHLSKPRCEYLSKIRDYVVHENCLDRAYSNNKLALDSNERSKLRTILDESQKKYFSENLSDLNKKNLYRLIDFYERVITCADTNRCDTGLIISKFSKDFVSLLNTYCIYFEQQANEFGITGKAKDDFIAKFLIAQAGLKLPQSDIKREKIFRCKRHRLLEDKN